MKKYLLLLFVAITGYAQTYQNPTFGTITTKTAPISTTPPSMATVESIGTIGKISPTNIPIPQVPTNYIAPTSTIGGHLTGIDNKLGSIVATTAGVTTRVWFTADVSVVSATDYYATNPTGKGTAASAIQNVVNNDNEKKYFAQDLIGAPFATATLFPPGVYAGNLSASTSPNSAQQRWTVELYKCDNDGTPIASGVTGATVGSLGVTTITVLDSGLLTLVAGSVTNVQVSGNLGGTGFSIAVGERIRYHVSAEKVGMAGGNITQSVYYGTSYNSFLDVPTPLNTSSVVNLSGVTGTTTTEALNTLNSRNMQAAYDSSTTPQVTVTDALGAMTWRNGRSLNTSKVTAWQNIAGTETASMTGNGELTAAGISNTLTGVSNGVNIKGGSTVNILTGGNSNTISGGGIIGSPNIISGGGNYRVIGGGYDNQITSSGIGADIIGGGAHHRITNNVTHATISGGSLSNITSGDYSTISGGTGHDIAASEAVIGGGTANTVNGNQSGIFSGSTNSITSTSLRTFIGGGTDNSVDNASDGVISGGNNNDLNNAPGGFIGGGSTNKIIPSIASRGSFSLIVGGFNNQIATTAQSQYCGILSGRDGVANGDYSCIVNGRGNVTLGQYSLTGGNFNAANTYSETVLGMFANSISGNANTIVSTDPIFRIGNGTSTSSRSDALRVDKNGSFFLPAGTGAVIGSSVNNGVDALQVTGSILSTTGLKYGKAILIPGGASLDTYTTAGFYDTTSTVMSSKPYDLNELFTLTVESSSTGNEVTQTATSKHTGKKYSRIRNSVNTWLPWRILAQRNYKVYTALITQDNSVNGGDPVLTELDLDLTDGDGGIVTATKYSTGIYDLTLTGSFPAGKTFVSINNAQNGTCRIMRIDNNTVSISTYNNSGTVADSILEDNCLEIRVYE